MLTLRFFLAILGFAKNFVIISRFLAFTFLFRANYEDKSRFKARLSVL